jgi:maleylpyruvate isomerase
VSAELAEIQAATARLIATAEGLDGPALGEPSLCEGWTRGHVLAHVSRNADGLVNLLTWARTGVETPQYASPESRTADIEAGAGRPLPEQVADLRASAARFDQAVLDLPADRWDYVVRMRGGLERRAPQLLDARLREVEIHHVDLDAGYRPEDWPGSFQAPALRYAVRVREGTLGEDGAVTVAGVTVNGPRPELLAWLLGRSAGGGLATDPPGPLPTLGDFG